VRLNDGTGHFLPPVGYAITTQPCQTFIRGQPEAADLNGDGRDEVIIGKRGDCTATMFADQTLIFRNAGNGTLIEPPALYHDVGASSDANLFAAADLNHDGHADVVVTTNVATTLLLNDGVGGFFTAHGTPMGASVQGSSCGNGPETVFIHLTPGDVNGDGRFDLVGVREGQGAPSFLECTVMLQDGQEAFTTLFSTPLPERFTKGLALADFDRDGKPDMAVATQSQSDPTGGNNARVARGNGDGTFQSWIPYAVVGKSPQHLAAGDLNGDLYPDLVVCTRYPAIPQGPRGVSVLLNNGNGTFATATQYDTGYETWYAAIADLNGDSHPDLAVVNADLSVPNGSLGFIKILLNNGDGTFTVTAPIYDFNPLAITGAVTLADVNGDAKPDMLVTFKYAPWTPATSGGVAVALNNGDATFSYVGTVDLGIDFSLPTVADLNADGKADLVTVGAPGVFNVHAGHGDGTFGPGILFAGARHGPIVADFDNDGRLDLGSALGCSPDWDLHTHVGFSRLLNRTCPACYPDCNGDGGLTVADFGCFQTKFVLQDPYADCNGDSQHTVADFGCFQTKFVLGCP
jgi:hypothetical protein